MVVAGPALGDLLEPGADLRTRLRIDFPDERPDAESLMRRLSRLSMFRAGGGFETGNLSRACALGVPYCSSRQGARASGKNFLTHRRS